MLHGGPFPEDYGICEVWPLCTGKDEGWGSAPVRAPLLWGSFPQEAEALPTPSLGLTVAPLFGTPSLQFPASEVFCNLDLNTEKSK